MTDNKLILPGLAIAKAVDDKVYRHLSSDLEPGVYPIDVKVHLQGGLRKGEPYRQRMAAAANPWALLRVALNKLNTTTLEALVKEALSEDPHETAVTKAAVEEAVQRLVDSTEREVSGRLTGTIQWVLMA